MQMHRHLVQVATGLEHKGLVVQVGRDVEVVAAVPRGPPAVRSTALRRRSGYHNATAQPLTTAGAETGIDYTC